MFFIVSRKEHISLAPEFFGGDIKDRLFTLLKNKIEGKYHGVWGYTVFVFPEGLKYSAGLLDIDTGCAVYEIEYDSVVFRPFKNEIMLAEVSQITSEGIFCKAGPLELFISPKTMPPHFVYNSTSGQPTFYSSTDDLEIRPFSPLRVRVLGTRISADKMSGIASINEDFLGPI